MTIRQTDRWMDRQKPDKVICMCLTGDPIRVVRRQRRWPGSNQHLIATKAKMFSKVGQTSRIMPGRQTLRYHVKGLVTRNTHVQYESPITFGRKVMAKVEFFKVGQTSRSRSQGQKLQY